MSGRRYEGPPVDGSVQYLGEAPYWQGEGETVDVVDDEPVGEERVEGVPTPGDVGPDEPVGEERVEGVPTPGDVGPDEPGQSTLDDWGWSA